MPIGYNKRNALAGKRVVRPTGAPASRPAASASPAPAASANKGWFKRLLKYATVIGATVWATLTFGGKGEGEQKTPNRALREKLAQSQQVYVVDEDINGNSIQPKYYVAEETHTPVTFQSVNEGIRETSYEATDTMGAIADLASSVSDALDAIGSVENAKHRVKAERAELKYQKVKAREKAQREKERTERERLNNAQKRQNMRLQAQREEQRRIEKAQKEAERRADKIRKEREKRIKEAQKQADKRRADMIRLNKGR